MMEGPTIPEKKIFFAEKSARNGIVQASLVAIGNESPDAGLKRKAIGPHSGTEIQIQIQWRYYRSPPPQFWYGTEGIEHVWICLTDELQPINPLPPVYRNFGGHCLMSGVVFPKIRLII
ncbi:transposable element Tcb1 transposase [Trichonephila clavipes]|nr:transposable element Tcb1 transposase [Trichonephila clavipes]